MEGQGEGSIISLVQSIYPCSEGMGIVASLELGGISLGKLFQESLSVYYYFRVPTFPVLIPMCTFEWNSDIRHLYKAFGQTSQLLAGP